MKQTVIEVLSFLSVGIMRRNALKVLVSSGTNFNSIPSSKSFEEKGARRSESSATVDRPFIAAAFILSRVPLSTSSMAERVLRACVRTWSDTDTARTCSRSSETTTRDDVVSRVPKM